MELTAVAVKVVGSTTRAVRCVTHGLGFDSYHLGCMFITVGEHRVIIGSDDTAVNYRCGSLLRWRGRACLVLRVCITG